MTPETLKTALEAAEWIGGHTHPLWDDKYAAYAAAIRALAEEVQELDARVYGFRRHLAHEHESDAQAIERCENQTTDLTRQLEEARERIETEMTRGEDWCNQFIAMRKERDSLKAELESQRERFNVSSARAQEHAIQLRNELNREQDAHAKTRERADKLQGLLSAKVDECAELYEEAEVRANTDVKSSDPDTREVSYLEAILTELRDLNAKIPRPGLA